MVIHDQEEIQSLNWSRRFPGVVLFSEIYQGQHYLASHLLLHSLRRFLENRSFIATFITNLMNSSWFNSWTVTGPVARFARQIAGQGYIVAAPSSYHEFTGPEALAYGMYSFPMLNLHAFGKVRYCETCFVRCLELTRHVLHPPPRMGTPLYRNSDFILTVFRKMYQALTWATSTKSQRYAERAISVEYSESQCQYYEWLKIYIRWWDTFRALLTWSIQKRRS